MRALIVEDERMIRQGLMKHIQWKELGVQEVCAASNAMEAFDLVHHLNPEIILSDIRMPGMDGIEFCRRIRAEYSDIEIILVTGFSEKEYLKAAIDIHVVGFVEKPINVSELSELIMEAVQRAKKTQQQKISFVQDMIWDATADLPLETTYRVFNFGLIQFQNEDTLRICKKNLVDELNSLLEAINVGVRMNQISEKLLSLLFLSNQPIAAHPLLPEIIRMVLGNAVTSCENGNWFVGIGEDTNSAEKFSDAYIQAQKALDTLAWQNWNKVILYREDLIKNNSKFPADPHDPFARAAEMHDVKRMLQILEEFKNQLITGKMSMESRIRYEFFDMQRTLQKENAGESAAVDSDVRSFDEMDTIEEMYLCVRTEIECLNSGDGQTENSGTIRKVTEYMDQHYSDPNLSIRILADEVYLTPTYLSSLFKKSTGKTIGQYLLDIRLNHAIELMHDPRLKFYQIAREVGYEDANYFAKIFKKKTGQTPSEFKEYLQR